MSNIAIITARGGSKRIPKKNIRPFLGKPIVAYSIESALKSDIFDEVMVSTDSQEIADVAIKYGAKVPFLRSQKNSDDYATTPDVIREVLLEYKKIGKEYDYFCCLYPTAPFVTAEKLKEAMQLLKKSGADTVYSATPFSYPIQRALKIGDDGIIEMIWPENMKARSQDLMPTYHDCGQFYCHNTKSFLDEKEVTALFGIGKAKPIIIPETKFQDIDNEDDWNMAEIKYNRLRQKNDPSK